MRAQLMVMSLLLCATPAAAQERTRAPDDSPVVRAGRGNIGMFFRFGGLATMGAESPSEDVAGFVFNQVGIKFALSERWMLPLHFGVGLNINDPSGTSGTNVDWGMMLGAAFEYHFRIWRRISPYVGAGLGLEFNDPRGGDNLRFAATMGPQMGIEFYWADHASLAAFYEFRLRILNQHDSYTQVSFQTAAGGGLTLTFYF